MKEKKSAYILLSVIMLIILLPLLTFNFEQGKISDTENRRLASFPKLTDSEGTFNSNYLSDFSAWFEDNLGMRDSFIRLSNSIDYYLLNKSPNPGIAKGNNGWLYLNEDNNLELATGSYPNFSVDDIRRTCELQTEVMEKLQAQGIEYALILPPSKPSVYPENIRGGEYTVGTSPADLLADYILENSCVNVIRLKEALLEEKNKGQQVYFKTDTHWNDYGAYTAYCSIVEQLNACGFICSKPVDVSFSAGTKLGNLSNSIGGIIPEEDTLISTIDNPAAAPIEDSKKTALTDIEESLQGYARGVYAFTSPASSPTVLMYGDSFFAEYMLEYLAENFGSFYFVWSANISQDEIDTVQPDIVLYDMTELTLNLLAGCNTDFLYA